MTVKIYSCTKICSSIIHIFGEKVATPSRNTLSQIAERIMQYPWKILQLCVFAAIRIASHEVKAFTTKCYEIRSWFDLKSRIEDSSTAIIPLCPFRVINDGSDRDGLSIFDARQIVCIKSNEFDECVVEGSGRHFNILGDGTTLIGINFKGSRHGAIQIKASSVSIVDCTFDA